MQEYKLVPFNNINDVLPILNKISLFGGLNDEELFKVFSLCEYGEFSNSSILFHKGDSPNYIYIILSGEIKIYMTDDNVEYEFIKFGVGDCIGEASLIAIEPHTATAVCSKRTQLILLSRKTLFSLHKNAPSLFSKIMLNIARELARRLHKNNNRLFHYIIHEN